jgi:hypothetical protein
MDFVSDNLIIILGLLIPFAGIIFPLLVLLIFQVRHPETAAAPGMEEAAPATSRSTHHPAAPVPGARTIPGDTRPILIDSAELTWFRDRLRESDVFGGLTDGELRYIAALGHRRTVRAGDRLAEGGSRGDMLFLVLEGQLRLLTHTLPELPVRIAHAGETVPLAAIIDPPVLVTSVEAASDGEVFAIPRKKLLYLLEKQPLIGFHVYRAAAKAFEQRYRSTLERADPYPEGTAPDV